MHKTPAFILLLIFLHSCRSEEKITQTDYTSQVGEIQFDEHIDDKKFLKDDSLILFFKPLFEGEKPAIINHFRRKYIIEGNETINGYATLRFYVNKTGETGKFRMQTLNFNYQKEDFNSGFKNQILLLTRELKGWKPLNTQVGSLGYYTYLNFKIINGEIKEITP